MDFCPPTTAKKPPGYDEEDSPARLEPSLDTLDPAINKPYDIEGADEEMSRGRVIRACPADTKTGTSSSACTAMDGLDRGHSSTQP